MPVDCRSVGRKAALSRREQAESADLARRGCLHDWLACHSWSISMRRGGSSVVRVGGPPRSLADGWYRRAAGGRLILWCWRRAVGLLACAGDRVAVSWTVSACLAARALEAERGEIHAVRRLRRSGSRCAVRRSRCWRGCRRRAAARRCGRGRCRACRRPGSALVRSAVRCQRAGAGRSGHRTWGRGCCRRAWRAASRRGRGTPLSSRRRRCRMARLAGAPARAV